MGATPSTANLQVEENFEQPALSHAAQKWNDSRKVGSFQIIEQPSRLRRYVPKLKPIESSRIVRRRKKSELKKARDQSNETLDWSMLRVIPDEEEAGLADCSFLPSTCNVTHGVSGQCRSPEDTDLDHSLEVEVAPTKKAHRKATKPWARPEVRKKVK